MGSAFRSFLLGTAVGAWLSAFPAGAADSPPVSAPAMPAYHPNLDPPLVDVDAMAARLDTNQDLYRATRDTALAVYAKSHPNPSPYDERVRTIIRLFAYLSVWDDYYEEGLWQLGDRYCGSAVKLGALDPVLAMFIAVAHASMHPPASENSAEVLTRAADLFLPTAYPPALKMRACEGLLRALVRYSVAGNFDPSLPSVLACASLVQEWGRDYREMIKLGLPHDTLFFFGHQALQETHYNQRTLNLLGGEIDRDFNEADPANPVRMELDGDFFLQEAWWARTSGSAAQVTPEGWKKFAEDLDKADKLLEPLGDQYPQEVGICYLMLTVELGQGQGRDRLETWFQRGIKINPHERRLYQSKDWYLQPNWYGSADDAFAFGEQCVQTQDWAHTIPAVLLSGLQGIGDKAFISRPDVWTVLEKTFRDYLERYPRSVHYRTLFASEAYNTGHPDIAREQLKILGEDWDLSVLPLRKQRAMAAELGL